MARPAWRGLAANVLMLTCSSHMGEVPAERLGRQRRRGSGVAARLPEPGPGPPLLLQPASQPASPPGQTATARLLRAQSRPDGADPVSHCAAVHHGCDKGPRPFVGILPIALSWTADEAQILGKTHVQYRTARLEARLSNCTSRSQSGSTPSQGPDYVARALRSVLSPHPRPHLQLVRARHEEW